MEKGTYLNKVSVFSLPFLRWSEKGGETTKKPIDRSISAPVFFSPLNLRGRSLPKSQIYALCSAKRRRFAFISKPQISLNQLTANFLYIFVL